MSYEQTARQNAHRILSQPTPSRLADSAAELAVGQRGRWVAVIVMVVMVVLGLALIGAGLWMSG